MNKFISAFVAAFISTVFCASGFGAPTFTISGVVATGAGVGVEGVSVVGNNGATSAVTGADGSYSITVSNQWDGTVSVSKAGWLITPSSKSYTRVRANIANENYIAYQPNISGYVRKADGTALSGASVSASGAGSTTTNASGYYEIVVAYGWSGTLSTSLAGYNFTAKNFSNVTADQTDQNFVGYQPKISGYVKKADGTALSGATVGVSGGASITTNASGYYEIIVAYGWSGTLSTSLAGYNFTAKNFSNVTADQTNQNFVGYQPKISGYVRKADGTGLGGAIITANSGNTVINGITDANGYYQITAAYGSSGMINASLAGYLFSTQVYSNITSDQITNFTGHQPKISGYVTGNGGAYIQGALITASNGAGTTSTNSSGYYELPVPCNWSGSITATKEGYSTGTRDYMNVMSDGLGHNFSLMQPVISGYTNSRAGVTVTASGAGSVVSNSSYAYSITVPYGWSGTVTASLDGYNFAESPKTYTNLNANILNQNFTAFQPSINGYVKSYTGSDLALVTITVSGVGSVLTDFHGYYLINVPYGWSGTVTAAQSGYYFGNPVEVINKTTSSQIDFTEKRFKIRGFVKDRNGAGVGSVYLSVSGLVGASTSSTGYFEVPGVKYNWAGVITPSRSGYSFEPISRSVTMAAGDVNDVNFTALQFTISGQVIDKNGMGVSGVNVSNGSGTTSTDGNGRYSFAVGGNWTGTLTPSKAGYGFNPANRSYSQVITDFNDAHFIAVKPVISGTIRDNRGVSVAGATVSAGTSGSTTTDANGFYTLQLTYNFTGTLTPSKAGYTMVPVSRSYSLLKADANGQDYAAIQPWIVGTVRDVNGAGVGGVEMKSGTSVLGTTDPNGRYVLKMSYNWSGTVSPVMAGYGFSPASRSYTSLQADSNEQDYVIGRMINLSKASCTFAACGKSGLSEPQSFVITSSGGTVNWHIEVPAGCEWLSVNPSSGAVSESNSVVTVTVDPNKANYGANTCAISVVSADALNSPQAVNVSLQVYGPVISCNPMQSSINALNNEKIEKMFTVKNSGYDVLHWSVDTASNPSWVKSVSPASGECAAGQSQTMTLQIDANGLADGSYQGVLGVVSPEASSVKMYLGMRVHTPRELHVPRDYPTISEAHNAAFSFGDTIIVHPGRYAGCNINKSLVIRSVAPEDGNIVAATIVTSGISEYKNIYGYLKMQGLTFIPDSANAGDAAITTTYCQNLEVSDCVIKGWGGGGIIVSYLNPKTVLIKNCLIAGNYVGGIVTLSRTSNVSIDIVNCTIADTLQGGSTPAAGIRMDGDSNNRIAITNSILSNRVAAGEGEIWFSSRNSMQMNYVSLTNSCMPAGANGIIATDSNYLSISYGPGNIESDPCFVRQGRLDDNGTPSDANDDMWVGGDYHLKSMAGRWESSEYFDMDADGDGFLNMRDMAVLASEWGKTAERTLSTQVYVYPYLWADLDNNGRVDMGDLAIFCEDYLYEYDAGRWVYDDVSSPCIDAGDSNSDWSNEPMPNGGRINMGAYGGTGQASLSGD